MCKEIYTSIFEEQLNPDPAKKSVFRLSEKPRMGDKERMPFRGTKKSRAYMLEK